MKVILNENNNPVKWGEKLKNGTEMPKPPADMVEDRSVRPKWDASDESWIHDPDYEPPVRSEPVDRSKISQETKQAILDARESGDYEAAIDHVLDVLDVIDLGG
ncbi:hypothetical protein HrrHc1_135 [Halorubrum phage Hardycor1]|nr:hypothetical protein HrrHc1_135 [Halorubrum phage Hardycor1]